VDFGFIDSFSPASVNAFAFRDLNAGTLPILYKLQFHVRDHAQDSDHHATHVTLSRDIGLKNAQRSAPGIQLMNQIQHITGRATQTIEAMNNELITSTQELKHSF
jgi:hypothetical protein